MFRTKNMMFLLGALVLASNSALATEYQITVVGKVLDAYTVEASLRTNLPDGSILAVSLGLSDLAPEDIAIGTSFTRVLIINGAGTVNINGQENAQPSGIELPAGEYDLEVSFHPKWKENKVISSSLSIEESIQQSARIYLKASGVDRNVVIERESGKLWVMENVFGGTVFDYGFWVNKFGDIRDIPLTSGNPRVIKMYYIEDIDMTLMVNTIENKIITWRRGIHTE